MKDEFSVEQVDKTVSGELDQLYNEDLSDVNIDLKKTYEDGDSLASRSSSFLAIPPTAPTKDKDALEIAAELKILGKSSRKVIKPASPTPLPPVVRENSLFWRLDQIEK